MIEHFHFLRPAWLLLLLPLAYVLWRLLHAGYDRGDWRTVIDERLMPFVLSGEDAGGRGWTRWILALTALMAILALAGPTWEKLPQPLYQKKSALVIALDLSRSMNATDIKPSRLSRARHKIADILALRAEGQTALLVYAADAFTVTPLTSDVDTILALLPALDSAIMPAQGSRADRALELAFELFENSGIDRGDVLLISDGLSESELQRIEAGLDEGHGHRLSVLAVGTPAGGPIPLQDGGFLKDREGAIVVAEMPEAALRRAARLGGGVYATISTDDIDINTLAYLMESDIDRRAARALDYSADLWRELGPGLLLLALPLAALAFRRGLIWTLPLVVLTLPPDAQALDLQALWKNRDQRADELFQQGEHADAAELFDDPAWRAASSYRAGDYERALQTWQALEGEDALYNRANALARLGRLEEALANYERLLRDNPGHGDALHNKLEVEKLLEQQKQQQQEQQGQQDGQQGEQQAAQSAEGEKGSRQQQQQQDGQQGPQAAEGEQAGQQQPQGEQQQAGRAGQQEPESRAENENDAAAQERQSGGQAQQADAAGETDIEEGSQNDAQALSRLDRQMSAQAAEQWLRKIPDEPGGLLRRKFLYQYRQRGGIDAESQPW